MPDLRNPRPSGGDAKSSDASTNTAEDTATATHVANMPAEGTVESEAEPSSPDSE